MNDRLLALYIPEWPAQAAKLPLDEAVAAGGCRRLLLPREPPESGRRCD